VGIFKELVAAGANVNAKTKDSKTDLDLSKNQGFIAFLSETVPAINKDMDNEVILELEKRTSVFSRQTA